MDLLEPQLTVTFGLTLQRRILRMVALQPAESQKKSVRIMTSPAPRPPPPPGMIGLLVQSLCHET